MAPTIKSPRWDMRIDKGNKDGVFLLGYSGCFLLLCSLILSLEMRAFDDSILQVAPLDLQLCGNSRIPLGLVELHLRIFCLMRNFNPIAATVGEASPAELGAEALAALAIGT
ncbi:hypothetical protein L6452_17996 [Arctium lappa]|uniref:Uncharacterized protein n=1 Tax=Arctium lappa TaxID=4217 RepID=A0ACB9C539_ARCLA|nr:hypothetical protein L6452_17996 [Arctium lappa]